MDSSNFTSTFNVPNTSRGFVVVPMSDIFVFVGACAATIFGYLARNYGMTKLVWAWGYFLQGWSVARAKPGCLTSFLNRYIGKTTGAEETETQREENWWSGLDEKAKLMEEGRGDDDLQHVDQEGTHGARDTLNLTLHNSEIQSSISDNSAEEDKPGMHRLLKRGLDHLFDGRSSQEVTMEEANSETHSLGNPLQRRATQINPNWNLAKFYPDEVNSVIKASINGTTLPIMAYYGDYCFTHVFVRGDDDLIIKTRPSKGSFENWRISPAARLGGVQDSKTADGSLQFTLTKDQWKQNGYWIVKMEGVKELVILIDEEENDEFSGDGVFYLRNYKVNRDANELVQTTNEIQRALDEASNWGRRNRKHGKVIIPFGKYLVGNLEINSWTHIHFQPGAVFTFSTYRKDYEDHWFKSSAGRWVTWWLHTKQGSSNITITGRGGLLDGRGKVSMDRGKTDGIGSAAIVPINTSNFIWDGPIIKETGLWAFVPVRSNNLTISNLKVLNRLDMGEVDCIDVCECQNVTVSRAIGIGLDDPFSTKTWANGKDISMKWDGQPEENINVTFRDCVAWTHCFGFKIGQGVMQNQSNILVEDCTVYNASIGIGVHHRWGKARARNIRFKNISIEGIRSSNMKMRTWFSVFVDAGDSNSGGPIENVVFENIKVLDKGTTRPKIDGKGGSINLVQFRNVKVLGSVAKSLGDLNVEVPDPRLARNITVIPYSGGTKRRKRREYAL